MKNNNFYGKTVYYSDNEFKVISEEEATEKEKKHKEQHDLYLKSSDEQKEKIATELVKEILSNMKAKDDRK
jgi:hypothetical protein